MSLKLARACVSRARKRIGPAYHREVARKAREELIQAEVDEVLVDTASVDRMQFEFVGVTMLLSKEP